MAELFERAGGPPVPSSDRTDEPLLPTPQYHSQYAATTGQVAGGARTIHHHEEEEEEEGVAEPPRADCCSTACVSQQCSSLFRWLPLPAIVALLVSSVAQYYSTSVLSLAMYLALDYSPQQTTLYWMYQSWVYWASPVVGWLSDWFVLCGQRRRPTIVLGVCFSVVAWTALWIGTRYNISFAPFVAISLAATLGQMMITVPLNGLVVEMATARAEECLQSELRRAETAGTDDANNDREQRSTTEDDEAASFASSSTARRSSGGNDPAAVDAHSAVGQIQTSAMLWKSIGSLLGAIIQTVVQVYADSTNALIGAPVMYVLLVPVVVLMRYAPQTKAQQRYARTSLLTRLRELVAAVRESCEKARRSANTDDVPAQEGGEAHTAQSCLSTVASRARCMFQSPICALIAVMTFVFFYNAVPDASVMYSQYLADNFAFPEWFLSFNLGISLLGSCIGCEIYSRFLTKHSQFRLFAVGCVAGALCYVTRVMLATGFAQHTMHCPVRVFVVVDGFLVAILTRIAFMPVLHVASERAPTGFEAFVFELFSVAAIGGSTVSALLTADISERLGITSDSWSALWQLLLLCAGCKLAPTVVAVMLPRPQLRSSVRAPDVSEEEEEETQQAINVRSADVSAAAA